MKKTLVVLLTVCILTAGVAFSGFGVSAEAGNLITGDSADFEGGTVGDWASIWGAATRENAASLGVDGSKAMKLSRTANWCGAYLDLTDEIVASGIGTYTFTLQMKAADAASAGTEQAQICFGDANNGAAGKPSEAAVTADGWVTVTYTFEVTDATSGALAVTYDNWGTPEAKTGVEKVSVKVQPAAVADGATNTVLIDNVTLVNANASTGSSFNGGLLTGDSADFEGGAVGGWASIWGAATRENVAGLGVDGSKALKLSRTANWNGAYLDVTNEIAAAGTGIYVFSLQMKAADTASAGTEQVQICFDDANSGAAGTAFSASITADDWTTVTYTFEVTDVTGGTISVTYDNWGVATTKTDAAKVSVKVQPEKVTEGTTNAVYIDNVSLFRVGAEIGYQHSSVESGKYAARFVTRFDEALTDSMGEKYGFTISFSKNADGSEAITKTVYCSHLLDYVSAGRVTSPQGAADDGYDYYALTVYNIPAAYTYVEFETFCTMQGQNVTKAAGWQPAQ